MTSDKKGSVRGPCYKLQMRFLYPAVVELKSYVFFVRMVVRKQYSLKFILVSHFYFEMFGIMADIFELDYYLKFK